MVQNFTWKQLRLLVREGTCYSRAADDQGCSCPPGLVPFLGCGSRTAGAWRAAAPGGPQGTREVLLHCGWSAGDGSCCLRSLISHAAWFVQSLRGFLAAAPGRGGRSVRRPARALPRAGTRARRAGRERCAGRLRLAPAHQHQIMDEHGLNMN